MSRSERLLSLLQGMRRHRRPVSGHVLAAEIGVSIRTLYRDIASLQAQGAAIEGEPGIGYIMKPGFMLPPLMFGSEELDALVLGMRLVAERGDRTLAHGALSTLAKISAVLPPELRRELEESALLVGAGKKTPDHTVFPDLLRGAIRAERKLRISYRDPSGVLTQRVVWPFALVYFEQSHVLMRWCELRCASATFVPIESARQNFWRHVTPSASRCFSGSGAAPNTSLVAAYCPVTGSVPATRQRGQFTAWVCPFAGTDPGSQVHFRRLSEIITALHPVGDNCCSSCRSWSGRVLLRICCRKKRIASFAADEARTSGASKRHPSYIETCNDALDRWRNLSSIACYLLR
jgi:biotin operon repressor